MRAFFTMVLLAITFGVSADAQAESRLCIPKNMMNNFWVHDAENVEIWAGRVYDVKVWPCHTMVWADRIAFDTFPKWSMDVCENDYLLVLEDHSNHIRQKCRIEKITVRQ